MTCQPKLPYRATDLQQIKCSVLDAYLSDCRIIFSKYYTYSSLLESVKFCPEFTFFSWILLFQFIEWSAKSLKMIII